MTFTSEQIQRAHELVRKRRKYRAIQHLLLDEFTSDPLSAVRHLDPHLHRKLPNQFSNISTMLCYHK